MNGRDQCSCVRVRVVRRGNPVVQKLRDAISPRDIFECAHCNKKTSGQWCIRCTDKPAKGTYWDENGHPCKPTARISPYAQGGFVDREAAFGDCMKETIMPLSNLRTPSGEVQLKT